ncbi:MAG: YibE/F family protein [Actinomycetota bacterium]|nr:YibE/F family protein [Actinomycetota bacterium]
MGHWHPEFDDDGDGDDGGAGSGPTRARGSAGTRRLLFLALAPFLVATVFGLVMFWPGGDRGASRLDLGFDTDLIDGTVRSAEIAACAATAPETDIECRLYQVRLSEGPDAGDTIPLELQDSPTTVRLDPGDRIVLARATQPDIPADLRYTFADFQRERPLALLALLFVAAVVALGRWRGARALVGLGLSLLVLTRFVLPSILEGNNAIAVSLTGSSVIMLAALYLSHGFNDRSTTAVLGTLASLGLTGVLAAMFVGLTHLTGLADEDARILQVATEQVSLSGLLLGGIIIGTLGVLDDVTVTQVSAVWQLHQANPTMGVRRLYQSALAIGRDHIASTVNTLVLAYAGASLPLLVLFVEVQRGLGDVLTGETVATEVVRTLIGSIGLVASVPLTTLLAALVISGRSPAPPE